MRVQSLTKNCRWCSTRRSNASPKIQIFEETWLITYNTWSAFRAPVMINRRSSYFNSCLIGKQKFGNKSRILRNLVPHIYCKQQSDLFFLLSKNFRLKSTAPIIHAQKFLSVVLNSSWTDIKIQYLSNLELKSIRCNKTVCSVVKNLEKIFVLRTQAYIQKML